MPYSFEHLSLVVVSCSDCYYCYRLLPVDFPVACVYCPNYCCSHELFLHCDAALLLLPCIVLLLLFVGGLAL